MDKKLRMQKLLYDLAHETQVSFIRAQRQGITTDLSLVNQFALHPLIPNKWFDWERRINAPIMIIGQDWGPYSVLKTYIDQYDSEVKNEGFDYEQFLCKQMSSRTEKFILNTIKETYIEKHEKFDHAIYDKFFFTMAVLFTRHGKHFRGNHNFDERQSFEISYPYVARQIEIVKPKVIMPLGLLGLKLVTRYFDLPFRNRNLESVIDELESIGRCIHLTNTMIIPNYHPASYTSPSQQKEIWSTIWEVIE